MDGAHAPARIVEVLRDDRCGRRGPAGSGRRGARRRRARRGDRRRARDGLGDGVGARTSAATQFGNVVLSRFPIMHHAQYDLSWRTCEPRWLSARGPRRSADDVLHLYNVHLGTAVLERRYQAGRLAAIVHDRRIGGPKVVLGDFNEWMRGLATKTLSARASRASTSAQHLKRRRTYPGLFPVLHLDHIYYEGHVEVRAVELPRTRLDADGVGPSAARGGHSGLADLCCQHPRR